MDHHTAHRPARLLVAVTAALLAVGPAASATAPGSAAAEASAPRRVSDVVRIDHPNARIAAASPTRVWTGSRIQLRGTALTRPRHGAARPRPVQLTEYRGGRWRVIARKLTTRAGAYTFTIASGTVVRTRVFRTHAPRYHGLRAATTRALRVAVVRRPASSGPTVPPTSSLPGMPAPSTYDAPEALPAGYVGAGSGTDWSFLFTGGARWNPCSVIRWAYNPSGQAYAALPDVKRTFAKISGVTGLPFHYVGSSSYRYLGNNLNGFPTTADIVVSWANEREFPDLAGNVVGEGGGAAYGVSGADVGYRFAEGYLTLDNGHALAAGFDGSGWGQVMLHEVLHSLGLGHASGSLQLMAPVATDKNYRFGAGDLTGMRRIGAVHGCLG